MVRLLYLVCVCVCVYSNSRNYVPGVAQWYGTFATHIRLRASVLVVFAVFCVHMHSFASLIRRTPPPMFSDTAITAITDSHSDTTIFQLRAHWVRISWSIGSEKLFGHVAPVGVEPSTSCVQGKHPIHQARLSAFCCIFLQIVQVDILSNPQKCTFWRNSKPIMTQFHVTAEMSLLKKFQNM